MNLIKLMKSLTMKYALQLIKAPVRAAYVFGQRVPTKYDVKREYVANMKGLGEIAAQTGDEAAQDYARGVVDEEIAQLKKALAEEEK